MRGFVFIDGSNFYFKLKQLSESLDPEVQLLDFDYDRFLRWLVSPHELAGARYYIGARQTGRERQSPAPLCQPAAPALQAGSPRH